MLTNAVVFEHPGRLTLGDLALAEPEAGDVVVTVQASGISAGTERLLWEGRMPAFPGLGYPLVPGYEAVGEVVDAGPEASFRAGDQVFVPGSNAFDGAHGIFGAAAEQLVVPSRRVTSLPAGLEETGILLTLAATAHHALAHPHSSLPDLIVGHGLLGRLIARLTVALGGDRPTIWERQAARRTGFDGVIDPDTDETQAYDTIIDASGDPAILDTAIAKLHRGGEIILAGFYATPLHFAFPPAFMREARIRVTAEFLPEDIHAVLALMDQDRLSLDGLISHRRPANEATDAYATAFGDPSCLKMLLTWRDAA
ncbi:MAG: chlorophyll synthesis pathway protein BchC [Pseudomonadota bacterium]